jgi:hypothetical protein
VKPWHDGAPALPAGTMGHWFMSEGSGVWIGGEWILGFGRAWGAYLVPRSDCAPAQPVILWEPEP